MQERIFYNIIALNIKNSNLIKYKEKELKLTSKIINLYTKFKYFEVNYKTFLNNENIVNIFYKSQKIYNLVTLFCNKLKIRSAKIYNSEDLLGNELNNILSFNILIDKFIYKFSYKDLIKIITTNLLNFQQETTRRNITNNFSTPLEIKNPYTNIPFKKYILYNFYIFCKNNNYKIPIIFQLYYESNFRIKDLFILHENYITLKSIKKYIVSADNQEKYNYLLKSSIIFCDFLTTYFDKREIKYLCAVFKNKIFNLDLSFINNNFDEIIYYYLVLIYYDSSNNSKFFLCYKMKLIITILFNKKIYFIDNNDTISTIKINDIHKIINENLEIIIIREINNYRLINNLDIILQNQRNNEEPEEEEFEEETNNNQEINNIEEVKEKHNKIILLKNKIHQKLYKLNDICENSKLYRLFFKIAILNLFVINCYINILILYRIFFKILKF